MRRPAFGAAISAATLALGAAGCYPDFDYLLPPDASTATDASGSVDAGPPPEGCDGGVPEGSTFTDLYKDFFGPTGAASCSANSICHVPGGTGAAVAGWECSPDQSACWSSMTSKIVGTGAFNAPEQTILYQALRKAPPTQGSGPMPRNSTFAFAPEDLERIEAWICQGAKND